MGLICNAESIYIVYTCVLLYSMYLRYGGSTTMRCSCFSCYKDGLGHGVCWWHSLPCSQFREEAGMGKSQTDRKADDAWHTSCIYVQVGKVQYYIMFWNEMLRHGQPTISLASFPGLLTPAFVTCSTASDKRWGEKAWEWGYNQP